MTINVLSARFVDQVALVEEGAGPRVEAMLASAFATLLRIRSETDAPKMVDDFWHDPSEWRSRYQPYEVKDGILQIPVKGMLLNDFAYAMDGDATGYQYIWKAYERGMNDGQVKGIALIVDSPGGEVAGNFDLVDRMFALRGTKPVRAYAAEAMYSAAYSIGSVADKIIVSRTGGVGSIGVVTSHIERSGQLKQDGIKVTLIKFGKHKTDGNRFEPLSKDAEARIQARIDELGEVFVNTVARNRGMDAASVRETEAATFTATQGKANGLADEIGSLDVSLVAFATDVTVEEEDEFMITQADVDRAREEGLAAGRAETATATAASVDTARKEGADAAHKRISAILGSDEAKKRPTLAGHFAFKTEMTAEAALEALKVSPEEKAEAAATEENTEANGNAFENAMSNGDNPNVGAGKGGDEKKPSRADRAMSLAGYKPRAA